ncbi:g6868 [Coccomyxa elongata]
MTQVTGVTAAGGADGAAAAADERATVGPGGLAPLETQATPLLGATNGNGGPSRPAATTASSRIPSLREAPIQALDEQQKLSISVIAVVAVLVANVSYLGYVTPPGGLSPYWESCLYETYIAFLVFNGLAFLFSLGAMGVVIVVPWLFPNKKAGQRLVNKWIGWGDPLKAVVSCHASMEAWPAEPAQGMGQWPRFYR